ncbi:DNA polymerase III subunit delta [Leadbettera azotonutricia]|uniref:DNA-directed DNA polymerase n=1 Tax=Leadbettera azotonutricia (strain ATCC BAA-888 / DSM 13862 / ZAS-9) TaxID=545695 RepID=F5YFW0_LEAAZ|nr:DNA polymerase III subunit delta [Leadbettera azotonutricia]AEF80942.1 DNA polymerase III, delta subunit [Leadbettera azotonutricia ZAS-9]
MNSRIFLGTETGEKQAAIDEIKRQLSADGGGSPLEQSVYYAGETPVSDMVSAMRNGSLFAESRLFLIKNADAIKKKDEVDLLASYMASPQDNTTLILISEETKLAKGLEDAVPRDAKKVFWELSESRKVDWVANFFRAKGFRINNDGIGTILELVENNTHALDQECTRLTLFLEKGKEIGSEEAEKWLSHTREESAFTLFARIASGDLSRSVESLHTMLLAKVEPQTILAGLAWCFRQFRDYINLVEEGAGSDGALERLFIKSPQAKRNYTDAGRRYNSEAADTFLSLTAEYDALLRSESSFPRQILMDTYLCKIHGLALQPALRR